MFPPHWSLPHRSLADNLVQRDRPGTVLVEPRWKVSVLPPGPSFYCRIRGGLLLIVCSPGVRGAIGIHIRQVFLKGHGTVMISIGRIEVGSDVVGRGGGGGVG